MTAYPRRVRTRQVLVVVLLTLLLSPTAAQSASPADSSRAVHRSGPPGLPSHTDVDYQLGGVRSVPASVGVVVRDRTAAPAPGRFNVCYVNGFQTQPGAERWWRRQHPRLVLRRDGRPVVDSAWGEWLLDLRTASKRTRIARIVARWTRGCAADGFDAVEFDNLDSFTRSRGLLRRRHAVAFARLLVRDAHRAGLPAGQKNLAGFDGTRVGYDFAVAEECGQWRECAAYARVYGDQVLAVEYGDRAFRRTCRSHGARWPVVRRDRDLTATGVRRFC